MGRVIKPGNKFLWQPLISHKSLKEYRGVILFFFFPPVKAISAVHAWKSFGCFVVWLVLYSETLLENNTKPNQGRLAPLPSLCQLGCLAWEGLLKLASLKALL